MAPVPDVSIYKSEGIFYEPFPYKPQIKYATHNINAALIV